MNTTKTLIALTLIASLSLPAAAKADGLCVSTIANTTQCETEFACFKTKVLNDWVYNKPLAAFCNAQVDSQASIETLNDSVGKLAADNGALIESNLALASKNADQEKEIARLKSRINFLKRKLGK